MVALAIGVFIARVHFPEESYGYYARWAWVPVLVGLGIWMISMAVLGP